MNDDGQIVAMRVADWKAVFLENRGQAFGVWREPFTELRVPLLFNLRRDPFERAQHNANTYNDWFLDRPFIIMPMQSLAAKFLLTMKEYPPSQTPGSFNLEKIQKMIEAGRTSSPQRLDYGKRPGGSPDAQRCIAFLLTSTSTKRKRVCPRIYKHEAQASGSGPSPRLTR